VSKRVTLIEKTNVHFLSWALGPFGGVPRPHCIVGLVVLGQPGVEHGRDQVVEYAAHVDYGLTDFLVVLLDRKQAGAGRERVELLTHLRECLFLVGIASPP
jgi:hypothetical protein